MSVKNIILLFSVLCLNVACFGRPGNKADTLAAKQLNPYGRYIYNEQNELELISSAVHFGVSFKGTSCTVYTATPNIKDHGYLQYELDGVYQKRVRIDGDITKPLIIKVPAGKHQLWIYKATEATTGPIRVIKVVANNIKPLKVAGAPLIEFIGNSITCGAASDASDMACGIGAYHDYHNAYMAYGPRVARLLKTNFILSSVSGIGVYRNWNSDSPTMPQVYENTDFKENSTEKWSFATYSPEIVSIALGTNDFSNGDGVRPRKPFSAEDFVSTYVKFVQLIKSKYPKAKIALLSSPMVKGASAKILESCLAQVKKQTDAAHPKDKPVSLFYFPPMEAHGCSGHPSVEDHLILAKQVELFFSKLLKE
jgi:hypothetical protein